MFFCFGYYTFERTSEAEDRNELNLKIFMTFSDNFPFYLDQTSFGTNINAFYKLQKFLL